MIIRISALLIVAFPLCLFGARAQGTDKASNDSEDCKVIGAMVRGNPSSPPMNAKSFGVNCDWKGLGLPQPTITNEEHPVLSFSYSQPVYSADGLQATVDYVYGGDRSAEGHPESYFYTGSKCTAEKHGSEWQFVACKMSFIT